jgi:uncharacterized protein involved in tolerance to divalent cations
MTIYEVKISAEDQAQADVILASLLDKHLVTGGQFLSSPARFWWNGEIVDMAGYTTITSYTPEEHRDAIIDDVRRTSQEEVPMITFVAVDAINRELHDWINETLGANFDETAEATDAGPDTDPDDTPASGSIRIQLS